MKYHSILISALASLCLLTSHSALATQSTESSSDEQARWFEIEIILFKQLSNNSENSEQFSANDITAKKKRAFDLLAPYLQPNIASLKKLLPNCEQPEKKLPYNITPSTLWAGNVDNESSYADEDTTEPQSEKNVSSVQVKDNKNIISSPNMSVTVLSAPLSEVVDKNVTTTAEHGLNEVSYQTKYSAIKVPVYNQYPISSKSPLCVIPTEFFQQNLTEEQLVHFSIDAFPVDKLTNTINGLERWQDDENGEITWASDNPYLISQDSLRLKSIANRLKRSRNYAPLLHLGWRQIGESRRQAKAVTLYAGDNLDLRYQQAIAKKESEQLALEIEAILEQRDQAESLMHNQMDLAESETAQVTDNGNGNGNSATISGNTPDYPTAIISNNSGMIKNQRAPSDLTLKKVEANSEVSIAEQLRLQAKQQQLDTIYQQFALLGNQKSTEKPILDEEATQRIIAQLSSDITAKELPLTIKNTIDKQVEITAPTQPWSIDGLFKVHLDHYLYINTEFNIIDSSTNTSVSTAEQKSSQNKVISFKQDRRVISGEIHYFDHPHIGMIVQIRRFDPSKPAEEAVSQSKK